jgi:hypothetical protein
MDWDKPVHFYLQQKLWLGPSLRSGPIGGAGLLEGSRNAAYPRGWSQTKKLLTRAPVKAAPIKPLLFFPSLISSVSFFILIEVNLTCLFLIAARLSNPKI